MSRKKQLVFGIFERNDIKAFGGSLLKNSHAKEKRPISLKKAMHVVLKSSLAKGPWSFHRYDRPLTRIILAQGRRHGVRVYRVANGGNHLHLVILPRTREAFNSFIRAVGGLIARLITGAQRGSAASIDRRFWDQRPYSVIIEWGRQFRRVSSYLMQNMLEASGFLDYVPRRSRSTA